MKAVTATLNGSVNPGGKATTYQFEYGTTTSYGSKAPTSPKSAGSGTSSVPVSEAIGSLSPFTTYHYRLVATNADGKAVGEDKTFTTYSAQSVSSALKRIYANQNPNIDIDGSDDERVDVDVAVLNSGIDVDHADLDVVQGPTA